MERWKHELRVLWVGTFLVQVGFSMIMPFLPLYLEDLHVDRQAASAWAGVIYAAVYVTMALTSPLWGALADRVGRRPMMLRSAFGMAAIVWLMGLATHPWQMLLLRLLTGLFAGFNSGSAPFLASRVPREQAGRALGLLATGAMAGNILGPVIGGLLSRPLGYRPIFFLTSVFCLAAGLMVLLLIPATERIAPPAAKGERRAISPWRLQPAVLGVIVLLFLAMLSLQSVEPILAASLRLLHAPEAWLSVLSGLVFSAAGLSSLVMAPFAGRWSDRHGSRQVLLVCLAGAAAVYLIQGLATQVWQMVLLRLLLGLFTGGVVPAANTLLARAVPPEIQGSVFGLSNAAMFLGNVAGPILGGSVAAMVGVRAVFPVTGGCLVLGLIWALLLVRDVDEVTGGISDAREPSGPSGAYRPQH